MEPGSAAHLKTGFEKTGTAFLAIADAVSRVRDLESLCHTIHLALSRAVSAENLFVALYDRGEDRICFPYFSDRFNDMPNSLDVESITRLLARLLGLKGPFRFSESETRVLARAVGISRRIPRSWVATPLVIRDNVVGVMVIQVYETETAHTPEDLRLIDFASRQVSLAIERRDCESRGQLMRDILETSPVGIALVQNRTFKWVNREMVRMFRCGSKRDLQGKGVETVYGENTDFEFVGKSVYQDLASQGMVDYETELRRKDNTCFPAYIRLNSSREEDPLAWSIATIMDISKRRAAERESVERERLQGVLEMAGAVCHEINQPLQAIIGYSELLSMDPDLAYNSNSIKAILSQATRLGKITATLSNITRYRTVEYPGQSKIVDIWNAGGPPGDRENQG